MWTIIITKQKNRAENALQKLQKIRNETDNNIKWIKHKKGLIVVRTSHKYYEIRDVNVFKVISNNPCSKFFYTLKYLYI